MSENRKKYSREFKVEAVKLVTTQGYSFSQAADSLGIGESMLRRWEKQLKEAGEKAFPENGKCLVVNEELQRLREENKRLRMERDILKKAAAFFAKETL